MLYKVEVRTPRGDLLPLQLDDISDGYIVAEISGLDPVKATVVTTKFAQMRGAAYQGSTLPERNITMKIEYDKFSQYSVSELRNRLYPFFMSQQEVSLRFFMEEGLIVDIAGVVESMESPLFVQDPDASISIICTEPDFIETTPTVQTGMTTADTNPRLITYAGTAPVGMVFVVGIQHNVNEVTIYQTTPSGAIQTLDFAAPLLIGDTLTISTVEGDKYAKLTRAGVDTSVLYGVSPQSRWLQLEHGVNAVRVYASGASSPVTSITHIGRYGGL